MAQPLDPLRPVLPPRPPLRHRVPGQGTGRHGQSDEQSDNPSDDQPEDGSHENGPRQDDELTYDDRGHAPPDADRSDSPKPPSGDQPRIDDYA